MASVKAVLDRTSRFTGRVDCVVKSVLTDNVRERTFDNPYKRAHVVCSQYRDLCGSLLTRFPVTTAVKTGSDAQKTIHALTEEHETSQNVTSVGTRLEP
eukprot:2498176-Amphidinium_carterae.9